MLSLDMDVSVYIIMIVLLLVMKFSLIYSLHKLKLDNNFVEFLIFVYCNIEIKYSKLNKVSILLWHKPLGYISKESLSKLVNNEILLNLVLLILLSI